MSNLKTRGARIALSLLLFVIILAWLCLFLVSVETAQDFPEYAYLQYPIFIAAVIGSLPITGVILTVFSFLRLIDEDQVFTNRTARVFDRARILLGIFCGYLLAGLAVLTIMGIGHPGLVLLWFGLEIVGLSGMIAASVLKQLFSTATELWNENRLTV